MTDGRRHLGIGSYERSWPVDVPFDSFGHQIVNSPSNRGAVGAFSCFTNTSLLHHKTLSTNKIFSSPVSYWLDE